MRSSTTTTNLFAIFTERLEAIGVRYMVTGSVAGIVYGEPRLTHDVDLVLELKNDSEATALVAAFPLEEFYCAPLEVVRLESRRASRGHFNVIHHETGFKADIYLVGNDPLHHAALRDRRAVQVEGSNLQLAPPEYVIVQKLEYYREGGSNKHLDDIRGILRVSGDQLDHPAMMKTISARGLQSQWEAVGRG